MIRKIAFVLLFALLILPINNLSAFNPNPDELKKAENFTLTDYNGKGHSLSDYKNSKAIVVMFIATQCPVSNDYNTRMAKIYEDYKSKDIAFIGINSNKQESVDEIKKHSTDNKFGFPVLKDNDNIIANKYEAKVTPEVFVLNGKFEILYHGRIDDSRKVAEIEVHDLRSTLDEILASKKVSNPKTKAFGCSIKRVSK
ncbi:MAG: thioredoxin family protein [Ignavibacteria bacterium]|nr:thioredoxin family protein [Ignavibacteria bacterium]